MRLDGKVTTAILGADAQWERWLAGVALSVSEGKGTFDQPGVDSGTVESALTSVNPYVRYEASERLSAWGLLGYMTLVGVQMHCAVYNRDGWPIAMLGFSTAAWKLAPRDCFIGWTPQLREKNLPLVVDNPRFFILPWITIPNLGSHILAIVRRQPIEHWAERYNTSSVLIETFVESPRHTGAVYKASSWLRVAPPRLGGGTSGTSCTTNPRRISGSGVHEETGDESSTGDANSRGKRSFVG